MCSASHAAAAAVCARACECVCVSMNTQRAEHACVQTSMPLAQMQLLLVPVELQNKYDSGKVGCVVPTRKTNKMATVPWSAPLARQLAGWLGQSASQPQRG